MTAEEFETELHALIVEARDHIAPLDGAWNVRSPRRDIPDYTIEITEIRKNSPGWSR